MIIKEGQRLTNRGVIADDNVADIIVQALLILGDLLGFRSLAGAQLFKEDLQTRSEPHQNVIHFF